MGDDVEIEDGFDADLLGSEDEDERGGGEQEEALLGVDAVCVTTVTSSTPTLYVCLTFSKSTSPH